jgi:protein TonB
VRSLITAALVMAVAGGGVLAQSGHKYKIGEDGVKSPVLIKEVHPRYTAGAKARQVQGTVELAAVVLKDGTVGDVRVTRSLDEELDQQAIEATKEWRFRPGTKDGDAVDVEIQIELTFTLK